MKIYEPIRRKEEDQKRELILGNVKVEVLPIPTTTTTENPEYRKLNIKENIFQT